MDHIEAGSRAIFLSSFKNQDMNLAICYLDLDKQLDDCKAESESRLNSYLAQIEATKEALDKVAELEGELSGLRDAYEGAMNDKRMYKKRLQAIEKEINVKSRGE